jgi:hypothetical protein
LIRKEAVIFTMIAYPKPDQVSFMFNCQGAITNANSHGPVTADLFKVQRWMAGIVFEQFEILIGQSPNVRRQTTVELPKSWRGKMLHRSVQRPSLKSLIAPAPRASSFPEAASVSS